MATSALIELDGATGEGGGQVLRTALGLSLATGRPFAITRIRGGRARPGLLRQHLACVRAATALGRAEVAGDSLGSSTLTFRPTTLAPGEHHVAVGSAGSALLVVQAVLPALLVADGPTRLVVEGGTHNPASPPFDFVERAFVPVLHRMGARVVVRLERHGFYPAGGGCVVVEVEPAPLTALDLVDRGALRAWTARALVSGIAANIGHRELNVVRQRLGLEADALQLVDVPRPTGPGNALVVEAVCDGITEVFTGFGEHGVRAERVAASVVSEARAWEARGAPVGEHLADQLLLPLALAGAGRFRTGPLTLHATTNVAVIERFLPVAFGVTDREDRATEVTITQR